MIRGVVILALLLTTSAAPRVDPQTAAAFRIAFGKDRSAVVTLVGDEMKEKVRFKPGRLIQAPFGPVLIAPGEVVDPAHVSAGKLAAVYLERAARGFAVTKRFVPAVETGSFGVIADWRLRRGYGAMPIVEVDGGGTWQGYTCSWTTLLELAPDKPKELVTVPLHYDDGGAVAGNRRAAEIDGRIVHVVPGRSFDVAYAGSKRFTDRYVRRGDEYVLSSGKSRMPTC